MKTCPHGYEYPSEAEVESLDIEFYQFCDCCGKPMQSDADFTLKDPNCGMCPDCEHDARARLTADAITEHGEHEQGTSNESNL